MKKNQLLSILVLPFLFFNSKGIAQIVSQNDSPSQQGPCATGVPDATWETAFSKLIEAFKAQGLANKSQGQLYTIPVIVHVIHGGQAIGTYPNLAQGQVNSQIRVLNEDFGGIGYNSNIYPATAFSAWAINQAIDSSSLDVLGRISIANCQVQFCLATKDTLGNVLAEPGIDRINYVSKGWSNPASFSNINSFTNYVNANIKPQSIWNTTKYLNLWVTDINSSTGLLGYATFPAFSNNTGLNIGYNGTPQDDGVWCYSRAFGSAAYFPGGSYSGSNNRGRTSSHEVGHWLGLRHIWGDGACANDYCNDTPLASASNYGNPNYPYKTTNCTGNSPNGEMFMNFMDYVNDNAKYMFTPGQALRIQTSMANSPYRKFLGSHNLCSVSEIAATAQFNMPNTVCQSSTLTLTNTSYGTPVPNYTWTASGGAIILPNPNVSIATVSFPSSGTFVVTLTAANGTTSIISKTIQVEAAPVILVAGAASVVCMNDEVILIAGGANTYTWQPSGLIGSLYNYIAVSEQTISVTGTDGNCNGTNSFTIGVAECVGLKNEYQNEFLFSIAPNPVIDRLHVSLYLPNKGSSTIEVLDVTGKLLDKQNVNGESYKTDLLIDLQSYKTGLYFLRVSSESGSSKTVKILKE